MKNEERRRGKKLSLSFFSYLPDAPNELTGESASGSNVSASSHASVAARSLPRGAASPSPTLKHVSTSTDATEALTSLRALSVRAAALAALATEEAEER